MKRIKQITAILIIILTFITNIFTVFSHSINTLPYYIKIGLFFDKSAKSTLLLESISGFKVGVFDQEEFISLFDLEENRILLRKDIAYIGQGLDFKEYDGLTSNLHNVEGPYHIQIGQSFTNYIDALEFINALNERGTNNYLSYEKEWKVFSGLFLDEFSAKEEADRIKSVYGYEAKVVYPSDTRVQVINQNGNTIFMYDSSEDIYLMGKDNGNQIPLVNIDDIAYRGAVTAKRLSNSDMTVINKLPLEEYLYGVVPGEMPALWPIEALKAQAVAARGYAVTNSNKYQQFGFNLSGTTFSQVYKGYSGEHPNTNRAVDETRNKVITYNGKLIESYYHSNSGGHTEDSENIWLNPLPYIRGVKDDFSLDTPHSTWTVTLTKEEIKNRLANNNIFIGDILDIKITSISNNGRVLSLVVYGTEGQEVMEKERSKNIFGLKSSYFSLGPNSNDINYVEVTAISGIESNVQSINLKGKYGITANGIDEIKNMDEVSIYNGKEYRNINKLVPTTILGSDTFVFDGKGYGHGLGMSQHGANKMAELGYKYDEILTYYYTGTKVE